MSFEEAEGTSMEREEDEIFMIAESVLEDMPGTSQVSPSPSPTPPSSSYKESKKKDDVGFFKLLDESIAKATASMLPKETGINLNDPDVMFCLNLASEMKEMTPDKKKALKKQISEFLYS